MFVIFIVKFVEKASRLAMLHLNIKGPMINHQDHSNVQFAMKNSSSKVD